ncbi:SAM-dependent methyltransferase [Ferrimonas marina]|uniref:Cyclopropane-fatty-acyl-phospholipid synthase n=1 Tax=Ferrimonas marina TaxID=299255 RepID=A0A1M5VR71_9GAMM|nr:cyclopropane-fatty-acyl-phospholipid synthase family protein [Ferrimonas marina]SHH77690.1 cyclopropane-fatty-acyl-phospholipid synthase [Ferrimonas marina]
MIKVATASTAWNLALCRRLACRWLAGLQHGQVRIIEGDSQWQLGQGEGVVSLTIHDPLAWRKLLLGGSIGMAEAYMDGLWDCDDLVALIRLFSRNLAMLDSLEKRYGWALGPIRTLAHRLRHNSRSNARKNIAAHYDLSNDFYRLFLDDSMLYSSALWQEAQSLEQAQQDKMERLCQQLDLSADDHLLEIGTGWGALAIHAAQRYGCRVTTTTLSQAQYDEARKRIDQAGLQDQITLLLKDYRDLTGQYDKIVSVEMIEAVGERYLKGYFQVLEQRLKPGGKLAIQSITIADQRYDSYRNSADFIQTYIFPGGFLPCVRVLGELLASETSMVMRDLTDIGLDYGKTLDHWHQRFNSQLGRVRALGFDDRFIRLWRYYFCYCQAGFETRRISTVQLTAEKV